MFPGSISKVLIMQLCGEDLESAYLISISGDIVAKYPKIILKGAFLNPAVSVRTACGYLLLGK